MIELHRFYDSMAVNPWSLSRSSVQFAHRWYLPCSSQTTTKLIVPEMISWGDLMLADPLSLAYSSINIKLPPFEVRRGIEESRLSNWSRRSSWIEDASSSIGLLTSLLVCIRIDLKMCDTYRHTRTLRSPPRTVRVNASSGSMKAEI